MGFTPPPMPEPLKPFPPPPEDLSPELRAWCERVDEICRKSVEKKRAKRPPATPPKPIFEENMLYPPRPKGYWAALAGHTTSEKIMGAGTTPGGHGAPEKPDPLSIPGMTREEFARMTPVVERKPDHLRTIHLGPFAPLDDAYRTRILSPEERELADLRRRIERLERPWWRRVLDWLSGPTESVGPG